MLIAIYSLSDVLEEIFDPLVSATEKLVREQIEGIKAKTGGGPKVRPNPQYH
jgi:hypothetical protein